MGNVYTVSAQRFLGSFGLKSVTINEKLMNEAEYLMKNYEDRGGCGRGR